MSHLFKKFIFNTVQPLMRKTENIRNVTIIAHIDHGKTTLSDTLLAASKLISRKLATELRYLDYDQIEQIRGITIKAANAIVHYVYNDKDYIINLIDTPGHIDFSGYVTRSLRVSDGALVVVDAVEGVMVQTETVTRQAINEHVKPILFINKVDRLIKEKRLSVDDFLKIINNTIRDFNILLDRYTDESIANEWRVSLVRNNVAFGSAKDKWGVRLIDILRWANVPSSKKMSPQELLQILKDFLKFVYDFYSRESVDELSQQFPVEKAVLEMIIEKIPNPKEAQKVRLPIIWRGNLDSDIAKSMLECNPAGPTVIFIYDVKYDSRAGLIATGRVFSGTIKIKEPLRMIRLGESFTVNQLAVMIGKSKIPVREIPAGNYAVIIGLKEVMVGETIVSPDVEHIEPFEKLLYVSEPVVTVTVEPADFSQYDYVQQVLSQLVKTEPGIEFYVNEDTGEMLLSGMGELQIEIFLQKLERLGIRLETGKPMVSYRESILTPSQEVSESLDDELTISYQLIPLNDCFVAKSKKEEFSSLIDLLKMCNLPYDGNIINFDRKYLRIIIDKSLHIPRDLYPQIVAAIDLYLKHGPIVGEPCYGIMIAITKFSSSLPPEQIDLLKFSTLLKGLPEVIKQSNPVLLEPWQKFEITTPSEFVGDITAVLNKRNAKIISMTQEKYLYKIIAEIPVRFTFGISNELRDVSRGYATWGAEHIGYRPVIGDVEQLITELKFKKGLS